MDSGIINTTYTIEILNQSEVPESELSEFEEVKPLQYPIKDENQEILIKRYMSGESEFPEFYTTYDDDDEQKILERTIFKPSLQQEQEGSSKKRTHKRRAVLNSALLGLMGEANICSARGQIEMAEKICLEIIRQNPLAPEPFYTLAEIYENIDPEKYINFSTIAAHLDPHNQHQWINIAEINIKNKNYNQARIQYSKAIKYNPKDYTLRKRKGELLEMMGEVANAMINYLYMIQYIPQDMPEYCLETAKKVANFFFESNKMALALAAMKMAYKVVPNSFSIEDINLYLQLMILNKNYDQVVLLMSEKCGVTAAIETNINDKIIVRSCQIPNNLPADLRVKLCISLIYLNAVDLLPYILRNFKENITITDGLDWYMDLIDALLYKQRNSEALEILLFVMEYELDPPALVWLRLAEVYRLLGNNQKAIKNYYEVINRATSCYDARLTLSALLKQEGYLKEAVKALEQDIISEVLNPRLLYEKCLLLKTIGHIDEFLDNSYALLARQSLQFQTREEILAWSSAGNMYQLDNVRNILASRLEETQIQGIEFDENQTKLTLDEEYKLYRDAVNIAFHKKRYPKLQKLSFAMATTKRFKNKFKEIEKHVILSSLFNNDPIVSYLFFREKLGSNLNSNGCWNFMNMLVQQGEELRYHRSLKRILNKKNVSKYLRIFIANYHMYCMSFKYALDIYVPIYKEINDPLICLCIGVCFEQIGLQKNSLKKATGVAQAISFMKKYVELRMSSSTKQEIYYNMGRMHHQSGVIYLALYYYEMALEAHDDIVDKHSDILGLQQEIAFNIYLIYKSQGNVNMAKKYLYKYCIV